MTIISRAMLCGGFTALATLIGAIHGTAEAVLITNSQANNSLIANSLIANSLIVNSLMNNALTPNGFTAGVSALGELNGVEVDAVSIAQSRAR